MGIFQYLSNKGCFTDKTNARTHTIMSGGTLYVSEDNYDEFLGVYAKEILNGNRTLAFSELKSNTIFRMYFDVDMLETKALGTDFLLKLSRCIQNTMTKFFPGLDQDCFKCVVCSTATKQVEISEMIPPPQRPVGLPHAKKKDEAPEPEPERILKTFTKNGYHLIFPFIRVDMDMALQLRFSVVHDIETLFGKREIATNPWLDVIDKAPYYNGLKMCGSVKSVTCKDCKGKKKNIRKKPSVIGIIREIRRIRKKLYPRRDDPSFDYSNVMSIEKDEFKNEELAELYSKYQEETGHLMCPTCGDKGWHLEDRFYMPTCILDGDGSVSDADMEYLNNNYHELMRWTSIRCRPSDLKSENYAVPRGYAPPTPDNASSSLSTAGSYLERLSPGIYREAVNSDMFANDAKAIRTWKGKEIKDERILRSITDHVRDFDDRYKELDVRQVFEMKFAKSSARSIISVDNIGETKESMTSCIQNSLPKVSKKGCSKTIKALENIATLNGAPSKAERVVEIVSRILVRVSGPGSTFCINKGDEHTTNSIYFCISEEEIVQKCFSRKDNVGRSGKTCKEFRSDSKPLSLILKRLLFKEEKLLDNDRKKSMKSLSGKRKSVWDNMC